eukprot:gene3881-2986_t
MWHADGKTRHDAARRGTARHDAARRGTTRHGPGRRGTTPHMCLRVEKAASINSETSVQSDAAQRAR